MKKNIIIIFLILFSCQSTRYNQSGDALITYRKTACMGSCPVYSVEIMKNGIVLFEGIKYTDKLGSWQARLNKKERE
ncbi:DUF6438 domain-containing protein, partial [Xanthovirga aplysinae]|uniref:DUF6438 domain-containing protein n=1 Tax=Xanthovirga aplysinae TaxID=2529853 RepID=UPI001CA42E63